MYLNILLAMMKLEPLTLATNIGEINLIIIKSMIG